MDHFLLQQKYPIYLQLKSFSTASIKVTKFVRTAQEPKKNPLPCQHLDYKRRPKHQQV
jgi:hypothetical protein